MSWNKLITQSNRGCRFTDTRDQLKDMVYARSQEWFALGKKARSSIHSQEQVLQRASMVREAFLRSIGGLNFPPAPLNPRLMGSLDVQDLRVEKIILESRPGIFVSTNLYKPRRFISDPEPKPGILMLCGHHILGKQAEEYQRVAQILASRGFVVLVVDTLGQGERLSYLNPYNGELEVGGNTLEHDHGGFQLSALGFSIARYMLHDAMRALDYLVSRPDVDPYRIGITGNSGGGTQTAMMMMVEDRIAAAAPATFLMNRWVYQHTGQAQDREQHWPGLTRQGIDHEDVLIAFAPRPVLLLTARDDFFPLEATIETYENSKKIYELMGAADKLEIFTDPVEHCYSQAMAIQAASFFAKVFYGDQKALESSIQEPTPVPASTLTCTPRGQVLLDLPQARSLHEEIMDAAAQIGANRKGGAEDFLKTGVYQNRKIGPLWLKRGFVESVSSMVRAEQWVWYSQIDMRGVGLRFLPLQTKAYTGVELCLWPNGTKGIKSRREWILSRLAQGKILWVVDLSGVGSLAQRPLVWWAGEEELYGPLYKLNDDLLWLDDSLAFLRTFEVLRALEAVKELEKDPVLPIRIYTESFFSLYAELALAVSEANLVIESKDPFESFIGWVQNRLYDTRLGPAITINRILEYTDMPEIRAKRGKPQ